MRDDPFPVEWTGRQAVVAFPDQVDVSNVGQLRDRLLSVINRGAAVLIADMTDTAACDHQAVEAVARACQRAAINGTQVRLVVAAPVVRRVLSIEGLDRMVSIYPSLEAATAAGREPPRLGLNGSRVSPPSKGTITPAVLWQLIDALGDGLALTDHEGRIALVNRRCAEMFGYKREELIGLPVDALVPAEVRAAHHGYRAGYHRAPQTRPMAERSRLAGLRKDGATLPVEISLSPLPTASEHFVLAVIRDATETQRRNDLADLARNAAAEQAHIAGDLLDRVVHRLFQVGLSLQTAASLPGHVVRERLSVALDQLDDVIHEIRDYAFTSGGTDSAPLGTGWAGELNRHPGDEAPDGGGRDPAQDRPVERLAQRPERRPVGAGHRQHRGAVPVGSELEVGVQHREQPAARAGGLPAQRQPGRPVGPGQLADLDPDELAEAGHADTGQARAVGVFRCLRKRTAVAESRQPLPCDGEADLQPHLIANEHLCISSVAGPGTAGTLVLFSSDLKHLDQFLSISRAMTSCWIWLVPS